MSKPNLLQNLAVAGIVAVGGVTLATPQKAQAATVYGFSSLEITDLTILGVETIFETETSDSAVLDSLNDSNIDITDAEQAFVTNNGVPMPGENFFDPWGTPLGGPQGTNFARGDVAISGDPVTDFNGTNVAEAYVNGNEELEAEADGEWEAVSIFFTVSPGQDIMFNGTYAGLLGVEITNSDFVSGIAEAQLAFNFEINASDGTPVFQTGFEESLGLAQVGFQSDAPGGSLASAVSNGNSFTFAQDIIDEFGTEYNIVIDAFEEATVRKQVDGRVPEPSTILGLLAVGGLGLGLKRAKQA